MDVRDQQDEGVGALVSRAIAEGRDYAQAEIGYWQALAADRLADVRSLATFGIAALLVLNAAVIALVLGMLLILTPLVGPGLATLIVVIAFLGIAGVLGWIALKHLRRVTRPRRAP